MAGAVPLTGEPTPINQGRLMMYTWQGQWTQAKDPLSGYPGGRRWTWIMVCRSNGDASPAVAIGVVMCAIGGTSLPQWMPEYAVNTAYGNMLAQARKARANGTIKGFLWYQGESDCGDSNNVIAYSQRMHALFSAIRQDLGIPDLPIIFFQLGPNPHEPGFEYWYDIHMRQRYIADSD